MNELGSVPRTLVALLVALLLALFLGLAIDMAMPTPLIPYSYGTDTVTTVPDIPAAKQAEFDARRDELDSQLGKGTITQSQYDDQSALLDDRESYAAHVLSLPATRQAEFDAQVKDLDSQLASGTITASQYDDEITALDDQIYSSSDEGFDVATAEDDPYLKAFSDRALPRVLAATAIVGLLLALGVLLMQRGVVLGEVPLLAGSLLAVYAVGLSSSVDSTWFRLVVTGAITIGAMSSGLVVFGRPAEKA